MKLFYLCILLLISNPLCASGKNLKISSKKTNNYWSIGLQKGLYKQSGTPDFSIDAISFKTGSHLGGNINFETRIYTGINETQYTLPHSNGQSADMSLAYCSSILIKPIIGTNENYSLFGTIGYSSMTIKHGFNNFIESTGLSYGGGARFQMSKKTSIDIDYHRLKDDSKTYDMLSLDLIIHYK